jgi:thioredoxin-like negative regulator of GroEL
MTVWLRQNRHIGFSGLRLLDPAVVTAAAIGIVLAGCEPTGGGDPRVTQAAYESLESGRSSLAAGQVAEARDAFEAATTTGGLQPDFYCEAVYLLGRCEAQLGNFDKARAAADILDQGDPDPERVRLLRELIRAEQARRPPSAAETPTDP